MELKSSKFNEHSPAGRASWSFLYPRFSFVYIRGYATPRHATVTLAESARRERERNKEEERAEAGERAQGLKVSPRNPRPHLALPFPPPPAFSSSSPRLDPRWLVSASRLCFDCTLLRFIPFFCDFSCWFESACAAITPVSAVSTVGFVSYAV
jgi:hypothetical protein